MSDIEIYASVSESGRAAALQAAIERVSCQSLPSLSVDYGASSRRDELVRRASDAAGGRTAAQWSNVDVPAAIDLIARLYHSSCSIRAELLALCSGRSVSVSLSCWADAAYAGKPHGEFRATMSKSCFWETRSDEVQMPSPPSPDEAMAVHAGRWAKDVGGLLFGMSGTGADGGFKMASICDEGGWDFPFDSYAVAHAHEESVALDFARGWLSAHADMPMEALAMARPDQLRQHVGVAHDKWAPPRYPGEGVRYDGSLSKADVLRILDTPLREVFQAIEAVCVPTAEGQQAIDTGETLIDALEKGAPRVSVRISARKLKFTPRVRRLSNGAILLHAGAFQPLWPIYRDAASLVLGR